MTINRIEEPMPAQAGQFKPGTEPQPAAKPVVEARPAWLPQKFKAPEELAKSYGESESKISALTAELAALKAGAKPTPPAPAAGEQKPGETPPAPTSTPTGAKGITPEHLTRFNQEVSALGSLSPASYKELSELGIPKEMADAYIAGQKAIGGTLIREAEEVAGGAEAYAEMRQWAEQSVSREDAKVIDAAFKSGDRDQILWAVKSLTAMWQAATSQEPSTLGTGVPSGQGGVAPFQTLDEMTAAIRHPAYRRNQAYREAVEARVAVSNFNQR